jgi:hypothetical protein
MGNIVSDGDGNLDTSTVLGKFINEWALNNYTVHPEFTETNQLKKRACCTMNSTIPIGLPGFDLPRQDGDYKNKINTAKFVPEYAVGIKLFTEKSKITPETCSIDGKNFKADIDRGIPYTTEGACVNFYDNGNKGFCSKVILNRQQYKTYPVKTNERIPQFYGRTIEDGMILIDDEQKQLDNRTTNTYVDCNCKNSYFELVREAMPLDDNNQPKGNPYDVAQNIDKRCSLQKEKTWKKKITSVDSANYTSIKVGNITNTGSGSINISAITGATATNLKSIPATPAVAAATPAPVAATKAPAATQAPVAATQAPVAATQAPVAAKASNVAGTTGVVPTTSTPSSTTTTTTISDTQSSGISSSSTVTGISKYLTGTNIGIVFVLIIIAYVVFKPKAPAIAMTQQASINMMGNYR